MTNEEEWLETLAGMNNLLALNAAVAVENMSLRDENERLREALRAYKKYGKHRASCVQGTGKQCTCGFDDTATRAGALSTPRSAKLLAGGKVPEAQ